MLLLRCRWSKGAAKAGGDGDFPRQTCRYRSGNQVELIRRLNQSLFILETVARTPFDKFYGR